jgi:hypothetical protein
VSHPIERLSFDEFLARGRHAVIRSDVPVVIERLPLAGQDGHQKKLIERLGHLTVTLFTEQSDLANPKRWTSSRIRLREFFERAEYRTAGADTSHRIVSNIRNRPEDVDAILGFDAERLLGYRRHMNAANLWVSHHGAFTRVHFDEWENFNIQLAGRKRFILMPPGRRDYYPRSMLRGSGDYSRAGSFHAVDPQRFPRLVARLSQRRDIVLEPGQMLYLPLGWWHQAESLDDLNINLNFWLRSPKILRRPHVLRTALCTAAHRRVTGLYSYQPEPAQDGGGTT